MAQEYHMDTVIAVWKPKGPTSFDVVAELRRLTGVWRIGHAGTLDPLAEGVLVIGIGREATRELSRSVEAEKEYEVTIRLGVRSTTDDEEGKKTEVSVKTPPAKNEVGRAVKTFVGSIEQTPPAFSAIKVGGRRAYDFARHGDMPELAARRVVIKSIKLLKYDYPLLQLRVVTGKGVYIRSLARDLGERLGTAGYVAELIRTRVGRFGKADALTLAACEKLFAGG